MHYIMDEEGEKAIAELLTRFPPGIPSFVTPIKDSEEGFEMQRSAISVTKVKPMLQVMLQAPEHFNEWLCDNIGLKEQHGSQLVGQIQQAEVVWDKERAEQEAGLIRGSYSLGESRIYNNRDRLLKRFGSEMEHGLWFPKHLEGRPDKLYWILKLYPHEEQADMAWQIILLWHETGRGTSTLEDLENHQAWVVRIEGDESCGGLNDGSLPVFHVEKAGPFAWKSIRTYQLQPEKMYRSGSIITYAGAFDLLSSGNNQDYGLLNWRW